MFRFIHADTKNQFGVVARSQPLPIRQPWYPERIGRLEVEFLAILQAPTVNTEVWLTHLTRLLHSFNDNKPPTAPVRKVRLAQAQVFSRLVTPKMAATIDPSQTFVA
jgi:hypothetical protein